MGKRTVFTNITPLPPSVSREVAVAMLHNHDEMIELNPLVIEHHPIQTPRNAAKDEFLDCAWHEMTDKIHYLPGGIAKGKVTYKGCFHNAPNGLQTHVYAPMNLDIRERWTVCGTLPGEPEEPRELGLNVPRQGLYLREDGEIKCNMLMTSFVRKNLDHAHQVLVERLLAKAERIQTHLNSQATNSPQSSIPTGIPSFQPGSHMEKSAIASQLAVQQSDTATLRSSISRTSSDPAAVYSARTPVQENFTQQLPIMSPQDSQKPLPFRPDDEVEEAELQTVHPALREQYRQSRMSGVSRSDTVLPAYSSLSNQKGLFYQDDLAKRQPAKHFAVELEGSTDFQRPTSSKANVPSQLSAGGSAHLSELPDEGALTWRPQTTYGVGSEIDDADPLSPNRPDTVPQQSNQENGIDKYVSPVASSDRTLDRYSIVSAVSDFPTPKAEQFAFSHGVDNRYSTVSALTNGPSPQLQQQAFRQQQQIYTRDEVQRAYNQNMF